MLFAERKTMASVDEAVPTRERLDEDDHDLLTFGEAGERLHLETAAAEHDVGHLEQSTADHDPSKGRARLKALRMAARCNSTHRINHENFQEFFGKPRKARRSLPCTQAAN
ncbi:acyl-CoA synthetase [Mycobacterium seoulense]|nr:acyl-CoA synthetase [Mycobacterium seoulense]